ncbi:DUF7093 family protein [Haloplanus pelagicus]|jgi:hypothetical protein|uniref:DUF7093 family protein n=1 Tax=Haloplanus pelagicus TaxID=2949995 RepID=UPI00203C4C33|nr:hypothetical protein [Haloplanus sp. HW8-1]
MGLRCLLGHEYANREVEREREERGDEVVVTYRTVETCDRCGERRIVSENKEVRPVRNPTDETVTTGLGDDGSVTPDLGGGTGSAAGADADADAAEDEDDVPTDPADGDTPGGREGTTPAQSTEADVEDTPVPDEEDEDVDDAVILDDDTDDGGSDVDRGHGEWPDADDRETAETAAAADAEDREGFSDAVDDGATVVSGGEEWPTPDGEDEGFDADPGDGSASDVSFGGGLTPEEADGGDATNGATAAAGGGAAGKQFVAAEEVEPVNDDRTEGATEFFCPNCGHARTAGGSSMRAGDICPDCHKGYIAERER